MLCLGLFVFLSLLMTKRRIKMNIGIYALVFLGGAVGALSSLYIVFSLFGTLGYKIFRKIKYGASLYD